MPLSARRSEYMRGFRYILLITGTLSSMTALPAPPSKENHMCTDVAAAVAKDRGSGRVLAAKARRVDGRLMCRIKILTPRGRVRNIYIDPDK